jgi:hypothetical protein
MLLPSNVELKHVFIPYQSARKSGFPVLYGDGSRPAVMQSAGISSPKAVMVMYTGKEETVESVDRLRQAFPAVISDVSFMLARNYNLIIKLPPAFPKIILRLINNFDIPFLSGPRVC